MCWYCVIDTNKPLLSGKQTIIDNCIDDRMINSDGSGYYFYNKETKKSEVQCFYGITSDDIVEKEVTRVLNKFTPGCLFIYHNRLATAGEKTKSQCHPIPIEHCDKNGDNVWKGWYIIHNGMLKNFEAEACENLSDTQLAARWLGQWMYDRNIKSPLELADIKWYDFISSKFDGSKVTIVHEDEYVTINPELGVFEDGFWKSASSKFTTSYPITYGYQGDNPNTKVFENMTAYEKDLLNEQGLDVVEDANGCLHYVEKDTGVIPDYDPKKKA